MQGTVKERLIAYLSYKRISKAEFGRRIGVSSAFVTSMSKSIQPDKVQRISLEFPDINISWLITGDGDMLKKTTKDYKTASILSESKSGYDDDKSKCDIADSERLEYLNAISSAQHSLAKCQEQLSKSQEQIDRLLDLLNGK
jgi:beta-glucosidase/6-phospho-beta-glucosidase/beta-galactosidase